jgi:hypothetical protein
MNKIIALLFTGIIFSGCANTKEIYIKNMQDKEAAKVECKQNNATMMGFVKCIHIFKKSRGYQMLNDSSISVVQHVDYEGLRNLEEKYWMVIAREVDEGRADEVDAQLEMTKVGQGLRNIFKANEQNRRVEARANFNQSLKFLDIYSKAIERTTPKAPQTIIIPRY